jgi:hypothetical protein
MKHWNLLLGPRSGRGLAVHPQNKRLQPRTFADQVFGSEPEACPRFVYWSGRGTPFCEVHPFR